MLNLTELRVELQQSSVPWLPRHLSGIAVLGGDRSGASAPRFICERQACVFRNQRSSGQPRHSGQTLTR